MAVMESRLYQGNPPVRATALPGALNPFVWRGVVETHNPSVLIVPVDVSPLNLARQYDPAAGRWYDLVAPSPRELDAVMRTQPFRVFSRFSQLPFWEVHGVQGGTRVSLTAVVDGAGVAHGQ